MHLPVELLEVICVQTCADGGQIAARLRLASRTTHNIVTPYRFHTIFALGERALIFLSEQLESAPQSHIGNIRQVYLSDASKMSCIHDEDALLMKERHQSAYNQSRGGPSALDAGEPITEERAPKRWSHIRGFWS
jgi:hypothetical protein